MARRWSRRRKGTHLLAAPPEPAGPTESVRLDGDDHAWWAQEDVTEVWRPKRRGTSSEPEPERDILAEHFGADWRTSFGFDPSSDQSVVGGEPPSTDEPAAHRDPYEVLEVEPTATWDEIIAAHRHQARVNHPDLLFGQSEEEKAVSEARIRTINAAYQELRVRRGV